MNVLFTALMCINGLLVLIAFYNYDILANIIANLNTFLLLAVLKNQEPLNPWTRASL